MKTTTSFNHPMDYFIDGLRKAATELEEFQVQLALGKAEAKELYENSAKTFRQTVQSFKLKLQNIKNSSGTINAKIEELELQLSLGIADSKDAFKKQKQKLLSLLHEIETAMKNMDLETSLRIDISNEMEKFKIKLEILELKYKLTKMELKANAKQKMKEYEQKIDEAKAKISEKLSDSEKNWEHFSKEINEAFTHLKKAFVQS